MNLAALALALTITSSTGRPLTPYEGELFRSLNTANRQVKDGQTRELALSKKLMKRDGRVAELEQEALEAPPVLEPAFDLVPWLVAGGALIFLGAIAFHDLTEDCK